MEVHRAKSLPEKARFVYEAVTDALDNSLTILGDEEELLGVTYAVAEVMALNGMSEEQTVALLRKAWRLNHEDWEGKFVGP